MYIIKSSVLNYKTEMVIRRLDDQEIIILITVGFWITYSTLVDM